MKGIFVFAAAMVATTIAFAVPPKVSIKDESFKDADGHRVLRESVIVDAPVDAAWKAFTTTEGFTRWAVPSGEVTPGNGGALEWSFDKAFKAGNPMNVLNRIDVYLPDQLIVWHNEHVPAGGPMDPDVFGKVRNLIAFEAVDPTHTRVTQTVVGFGDDAKFDALYQHLRSGNASYLEMLANNFHETDAEARAALN